MVNDEEDKILFKPMCEFYLANKNLKLWIMF